MHRCDVALPLVVAAGSTAFGTSTANVTVKNPQSADYHGSEGDKRELLERVADSPECGLEPNGATIARIQWSDFSAFRWGRSRQLCLVP